MFMDIAVVLESRAQPIGGELDPNLTIVDMRVLGTAPLLSSAATDTRSREGLLWTIVTVVPCS
jgi:hypothetical protein